MPNTSLPGGSLPVGDLSRIVDDAALFASKDSGFPTINAIHLESTPERLIAVATDRFTLGSATASYLDDSPGDEFNLSLKLGQAQILSRIAKSCKTAFSNVTVNATSGSVTFSFTSGESLTLPTLSNGTDEKFPDWREVIRSLGAQTDCAVEVIGLNPGFLAKFSKVTNARQMAIKFSGPSRGALVSISDQFVGVIMPVRISGDAELNWKAPAWLERQVPKSAKTPRTRRTPAKKAS